MSINTIAKITIENKCSLGEVVPNRLCSHKIKIRLADGTESKPHSSGGEDIQVLLTQLPSEKIECLAAAGRDHFKAVKLPANPEKVLTDILNEIFEKQPALKDAADAVLVNKPWYVCC